MLIKTLFKNGGVWETGEVEVHLLPGIPNLHVVGLPDAQIKESGIKLKSALKASGYSWPRGHQIIVNLRPNHFRKSSAGVELAIALGFLAKSKQLPEEVLRSTQHLHVYGEVALDGRVLAPHDLPSALHAVNGEVLTGMVGENLREGEWSEISSLSAKEVTRRQRFFDWESFWCRPQLLNFSLHPQAAQALWLSLHMNLHVMVAGPQGTGKSTWAKILYSLTAPPDVGMYLEREDLIGREDLRWRPLEQPHHSITPLAMVGGGYPIAPGVISRAHGGVLVMDEFLEFQAAVLENLREPLESGWVEIARKGVRERIPARFQLIATTNLCPCGKLRPQMSEGCPLSGRPKCLNVIRRLSGPLLDRFDIMLFSHRWNESNVELAPVTEVAATLTRVRDFAAKRGVVESGIPEWIDKLALNHRRRASLLRVARGLADYDESVKIEAKHFSGAIELVVDPILSLDTIFG